MSPPKLEYIVKPFNPPRNRLLGGVSISAITASTDANTLATPGFYQGTAFVNTPQAAGILIMPYYKEGYWRFQFFMTNIGNYIWFRAGTSSNYGSWMQFTITTY